MSIDVSAIKDAQRKMWTIGDYPEIARTIAQVGELVAERADPQPGQDLLDVATGSGNVAIPAALAGAKVTGLDLTPKLLEVARERAAEAGVEIDFVEGDAEDLPFDDRSFERVTSCFGVMFAPRQDVAAGELVRVARPGARIVVAAWTPEGLNGRMFRTVGSYMPPPPPELKPPVMWGNEDHVRGLFADSRSRAGVRAPHGHVRARIGRSVARTQRAAARPDDHGEGRPRAAGALGRAARGASRTLHRRQRG